jgi:hypothetical protein
MGVCMCASHYSVFNATMQCRIHRLGDVFWLILPDSDVFRTSDCRFNDFIDVCKTTTPCVVLQIVVAVAAEVIMRQYVRTRSSMNLYWRGRTRDNLSCNSNNDLQHNTMKADRTL